MIIFHLKICILCLFYPLLLLPAFMSHTSSDDSNEKRDQYVNITRFLTYFGLCVATCVIFQSSTHIAYIVGAAVAIYIAASEYWLSSTPAGANKPQIDTKQLEEMLMKSL